MADLVEESLNQHLINIYFSFLSYVNIILNNKLVFDIEDSKWQEILEKVISKISDMLDETFAKFEHSLRFELYR